MDQISQIQLYIASITQTMIEDLQWMQTVTLSPGEAHAIHNLATKGNTGVIGVDSLTQPLNIYEINRAADLQLSTIERAERFFNLLSECDIVISMLPAHFSSEKEQLEELKSLKKEFYEATEELRVAEYRAEHCQKQLQDLVGKAGTLIHPILGQIDRKDL